MNDGTSRSSCSVDASEQMACRSVVFPLPLSPKISVHGAGVPCLVARFSRCFGPKPRTFSISTPSRYAGTAPGSTFFARRRRVERGATLRLLAAGARLTLLRLVPILRFSRLRSARSSSRGLPSVLADELHDVADHLGVLAEVPVVRF